MSLILSRIEKRRGRLSRHAVVETAVTLFISRGYDRTSMNEIASALGTTKAALYYYFPSKEDIFIAGIHRASEVIEAGLARSADLGASAAKQIENFIRAYGSSLRDPIFRCLVLADERVLGAEGQAKLRECKRRNQRQLEALLEGAGVDEGEVRGIALAIFGALNWAAASFADRASAELDGVTNATLSLLTARLGAPGP